MKIDFQGTVNVENGNQPVTRNELFNLVAHLAEISKAWSKDNGIHAERVFDLADLLERIKGK